MLPEPYYQDDSVTLYNADCREILPHLPQVDLVLTDPPYASGARRDADRQVRGAMLREAEDSEWFSHDAMTTWGFTWFLRGALVDLRSVLARGAHVYLFTDWRQTPNVYGLMESAGYRVNHCLVWDKSHFGMGTYWRNQHENIVFASNGQPAAMLNRGMGTVLRHPTVSAAARKHPTEKPVDLLSRIISAVPGNLVCDPFAGSGATLEAAKKAGRKAVGVEINPDYCKLIAGRLSQNTLPLTA